MLHPLHGTNITASPVKGNIQRTLARMSFLVRSVNLLFYFHCITSSFYGRASFRHSTSLSLPPIRTTGSEAPSRPPTTGLGRGTPHPIAGLAHSNAFSAKRNKWPNATSTHTTGEPCSPALALCADLTWPGQCGAWGVCVDICTSIQWLA